jgi:hypothetical protein
MTLDNTLEIEAETRTGQIKIHKSEDFEGMRKAGKLAAECLDMLIPHVRSGRLVGRAGPAGPRVHPRPQRPARLPVLSRLSQDGLHFAQPRRLPRHPGRLGAA